MPARKKSTKPRTKPIAQYDHADKARANNPQVGLVTPSSDPDKGERRRYAYDPHLDPQLQWAGKAEHTSFDVPTQSLHVHERIDPRTIVDAVRKYSDDAVHQGSLFDEERKIPLRNEIEFYQHSHNWSNRLIAGDSLLVMNSLLEKENMARRVQCVYMDPPYGIKYGSNFQPFVNRRDVKDGKDDDLTSEPEQIRAFRDTWELGIHSYLSYLRDRLLLARELLTDSGSCFVQISDENVHHVREIMDEVFGVGNFVKLITFQKTSGQETKILPTTVDFLIWYGKDITQIKYRQLFLDRLLGNTSLDRYDMLFFADGKTERLTADSIKTGIIPPGTRRYQLSSLYSEGGSNSDQGFEFDKKIYKPRNGTHWKTTVEGMEKLAKNNRIEKMGSVLRYRRFADDFPVIPITDRWQSVMLGTKKNYIVETSAKTIQRCILMTTDPGDLVLDPTCGSGTSAFVAEQWGRRWITCDTSRVALTLAKQRLMTASFDYYKLAHPAEGVGSGFEYKKVPHVTLKSIANNEPPATETLYDQPFKDTKKARITGPFTVEAVPAPTVQPLDAITAPEPAAADETIVRSGETLRQSEWRDELLKSGIRGKGGQHISFSRIETLPCHYLHADAETKPDDSGADGVKDVNTAGMPRRAVISFGPEHAPLEQRQVENAVQEAQTLVPKPELVVFVAFQFDPEAAKDIDETDWPGVKMLKVQMNADLQTDDLKKKRASNESFWLIGQPDVSLRRIRRGENADRWQVEVHGFDYFNTKSGDVESGNTEKIAVWMLDTDYDGRSLYPSQVFFPMAGAKEGWSKLARNLKSEIDDELIEAYRGTLSLPFDLGENERIAVKIVDDRGIESLRVLGAPSQENKS
ncbi:site-specific DNA-methyltransferase [Candidatus Spongiihabitans sp.]|uniref:site-specific DNA-methyltransferase n=1 Tax=Candidatus Spongiihabitans sp. TaxID=3101308 RepID=UPI003C7B7885